MRETLKKLRDALRPIYGRGESEAIIRILFHYLKGWNTTDMLIHENEELSPYLKGEIEAILLRLKNYEPIQYITGEARFHGMELKVRPGVLIPRPETEQLVDIITDDAGNREDLRVLDVGTGSGCIAIALARSLKFPTITALDISDIAVATAKENAMALKADINIVKADIFEWKPRQQFDIIVSNPPYIDESEKPEMERNVLDFEPPRALFVPDNDPICFYRQIGNMAAGSLPTGGMLYFEINPRHCREIEQMLATSGFNEIESLRDSFGRLRFIKARK